MSKLARAIGSLRFPLAKPTWPTSVERPAKKPILGVDFDTDWARRAPARLARAVVTDNLTVPAIRALAPAVIEGAASLERLEGPVIFAANHASHADTAVILATLPPRLRHRTVVAAASDYFFDTRLKATMSSLFLNAIPIERTKVSRRSAKTALELLEEGWNLVIYPEGGRTPDGWMHEFKNGAAYLSVKSGAPVVPLWLEGTGRVLPKRAVASGDSPGGSGSESTQSSRLRRAPVSVIVGRPLSPAEGEDARRFGPRIEEAVGQLGLEVASDFWTARRSPDEALLRGPDASAWRRSWARPAAAKVSERRELPSWPERD